MSAADRAPTAEEHAAFTGPDPILGVRDYRLRTGVSLGEAVKALRETTGHDPDCLRAPPPPPVKERAREHLRQWSG